MHRFDAVNGAFPTFFWSTIVEAQAVAGDNGDRVFAFAKENSESTFFEIFEIDPLVDQPPIGRIPAPSQDIVGLAFDGTFLYASDINGMLFTLDANDGSIINEITLSSPLTALATTATVPEPGTVLGLLAISGLGLGLKGKKQS